MRLLLSVLSQYLLGSRDYGYDLMTIGLVDVSIPEQSLRDRKAVRCGRHAVASNPTYFSCYITHLSSKVIKSSCNIVSWPVRRQARTGNPCSRQALSSNLEIDRPSEIEDNLFFF